MGHLIEKVQSLLQREFPKPDIVSLEDDDGTGIIGEVTSKRFLGLEGHGRQDLIGGALDGGLTLEEKRRIVIIVGITPWEKKAQRGSRVAMDETVLEDTVARLHRHGQAATYGAVAGVVRGYHRTMMQGRAHNHLNSWVVNKNSRVPTGYDPDEIDPRLPRSIAERGVIETPEDLDVWRAEHR